MIFAKQLKNLSESLNYAILDDVFMLEREDLDKLDLIQRKTISLFESFNGVLSHFKLKLRIEKLHDMKAGEISIADYDEFVISELFKENIKMCSKKLLKIATKVTLDTINGAEEVTNRLHKLQKIKGEKYRNSWQKRGEIVSIFGNVARKFDRIENIIKAIQTGKKIDTMFADGEEPLIETITDLANYCILWICFIKIMRPSEYQSWLKRNLLEE